MKRSVAVAVAALLAVVAIAAVAFAVVAGPRDPKGPPSPTTTTTAGGRTGPAAPAASSCTPNRTPPTGGPTTNGTLAFGGLDRRYTLHLPPAYDGTSPTPLVLDFHGHGSSAGIQLAYSAITPVADREGFVVVAPEGQGAPPHFTLLGATATEADDVAFTLALLDRLEQTLCLDPQRVFAMGMSNGGALSSVLACRAGDRIAAVGAVAAMVFLPEPCEDARRVAPITSFMGTGDPIVPFAGGRVNCCGNPTIPAAEDTMRSFADRAGCDATPATERPAGAPTVEHRTWEDCDDGSAVELFVIEGGGHTWPGSPFDASSRGLGPSTSGLPATELLWSFFEAHPLPAA